jgi:putative hydrolase of the HAD superfamily
MTRCVLFDLDGTLYDFDTAAAHALAEGSAAAERLLGIPAEQIRADLRRILEEQRSIAPDQAGYHSRLVRFQRILEEHRFPLKFAVPLVHTYWRAFLDAMTPFPDADATLAALHERGLRIGLGTNMSAYMQFLKLERLGLIDRFDFVVTSEETAAEKPLSRFFSFCERKALCPAAECLFVGDNLQYDVLGAVAAGMQGLWLQPDAAKRAEHPEVRSIATLGELLSRFSQP